MKLDEFDRVLLAFTTRVEAEAIFFLQELGEVTDWPSNGGRGYGKTLEAIYRNASNLRRFLLANGRYLTESERAKILDTSNVDKLLLSDD